MITSIRPLQSGQPCLSSHTPARGHVTCSHSSDGCPCPAPDVGPRKVPCLNCTAVQIASCPGGAVRPYFHGYFRQGLFTIVRFQTCILMTTAAQLLAAGEASISEPAGATGSWGPSTLPRTAPCLFFRSRSAGVIHLNLKTTLGEGQGPQHRPVPGLEKPRQKGQCCGTLGFRAWLWGQRGHLSRGFATSSAMWL